MWPEVNHSHACFWLLTILILFFGTISIRITINVQSGKWIFKFFWKILCYKGLETQSKTRKKKQARHKKTRQHSNKKMPSGFEKYCIYECIRETFHTDYLAPFYLHVMDWLVKFTPVSDHVKCDVCISLNCNDMKNVTIKCNGGAPSCFRLMLSSVLMHPLCHILQFSFAVNRRQFIP